jgi:hypothetical protein
MVSPKKTAEKMIKNPVNSLSPMVEPPCRDAPTTLSLKGPCPDRIGSGAPGLLALRQTWRNASNPLQHRTQSPGSMQTGIKDPNLKEA